ncbi:MAG: hypothetical protein J0H00_22350 [Burkholderiales bacterium]|nr:hypothetical protein [Burkholderiales bacterium]
MMQRRRFLGSVAAGGALAGAPLIAQASLDPAAAAIPHADSARPLASAARAPVDTARPTVGGMHVAIVSRNDLPEAAALSRAIAATLREAGARPVLLERGSDALAAFDDIDAMLAGAGTHLVGIVDDAQAVLLHEVAAARGGGFLVEARHRFHARAVRHHLRGPDGADPVAWSDPLDEWPRRIAQCHAAALAGRPLPPAASQRPLAGGRATGIGLVSFVLAL